MTSFRLSKGPGRSIILANAIAFISALPESKDWRITIDRVRKTRSREQNRMLWAIYAQISDQTGYEKDELHTLFLGSWSGWEVIEMFGEKRKRPNHRSSSMTKAEFSDYIDFIIRKCIETNISIHMEHE